MSDFEFDGIKKRIQGLLDLPDDALGDFTKENLQKYSDKLLEAFEMVKNDSVGLEELVLTNIKKLLAQITEKPELQAMSREDLYKFLDTEILPASILGGLLNDFLNRFCSWL